MKLTKLPLIVILGSFVFLIGNTAQAGEKSVSFSAKLLAVDANEGCAIVDVDNIVVAATVAIAIRHRHRRHRGRGRRN